MIHCRKDCENQCPKVPTSQEKGTEVRLVMPQRPKWDHTRKGFVSNHPLVAAMDLLIRLLEALQVGSRRTLQARTRCNRNTTLMLVILSRLRCTLIRGLARHTPLLHRLLMTRPHTLSFHLRHLYNPGLCLTSALHCLWLQFASLHQRRQCRRQTARLQNYFRHHLTRRYTQQPLQVISQTYSDR